MTNNKLIDGSLLVIAIASLGFGGANLAHRISANSTVIAQNAKTDKANKQIKADNHDLVANTFNERVSRYLQSIYNGGYGNADAMWHDGHSSDEFKGFEKLQGDDKAFFKSSYEAGAESSVQNITTSINDNKFVVSFIYQVEHNGTNASRITSQKVYVLQGHVDNGRYVVDTTASANLGN